MSDPFAEIRPFNDDEVQAALTRILGSKQCLTALLRFRLGDWCLPFAPLLRPLARLYLHGQARDLKTINDFQMRMKAYMEQMIENTTSGFSVSGLEQLDPAQAYLFISNHRDIAMDPAFTNYALHRAGHQTLRIAIGDNLLHEQWVADLMRLNKSFIVQRSLSGPRELLAASKLLANYIRFSIYDDNVPVWIAQREGRAKNGVDRTETAIVKMLSLSRNKRSKSLSEHVRDLRIVPVAISYELDPCDEMKGTELYQLETTGSYKKTDREDVASIGLGISGAKGRVHVSFGSPLNGNFESPEEVAVAIDDQIVGGYHLFRTSLWAYQKLFGEPEQSIEFESGSVSEREFRERVDAMPEGVRSFVLAGYANSLRSRLEHLSSR
ncbi:MAG: 1-acyl-sn-glycerol-3-phosphate acyltransferase [Pseudomonadota bacterium]